jgi:hypothetical protein
MRLSTRLSTRLFSTFSFAMVFGAAACGSDNSAAIVHDDDGGPTDDADAIATDGPANDTGPDPDGGRPGCSAADAGGGDAPTARGDAMGSLDASGTQLLVFGGDLGIAPCAGAPKHNIVAETWILDVGCGTWRSVDGPAPGARVRGATATDFARNRSLVFGGRTLASGSTYTELDELWAFDFAKSTWGQLTTHGTGPSGRSNSAMVVSQSADKAYVFGGNTSTDGLTFTPTADTFSLDLGTLEWAPIAEASGLKPPARLFHVMAIDEHRGSAGSIYVFSGGDANAFTGPFLKDLWRLDLATENWERVAVTGTAPQARIAATMVFDQVSKKLVLFGGHDDGDMGNENDLWTLDPTTAPITWQKLTHGDTLNDKPTTACSFPADFTTIDQLSPERREAFVTGARNDGHGFVIYSGKGDCGNLGDALWYSGGGDAWTGVFKSPVGQSCLRYSTTCTGLCG